MTEAPLNQAPAAPSAPPRLEQAVKVVSELMQLIDYPGRLEAKDAADGGIWVAMHPDGTLPGIAQGKRSHVVDALQFIANKIVNKSGTSKRWISIGVGGFPAPRPPPAARPAPQAAAVSAPERRPAPAPRPSPASAPASPASLASFDDEASAAPNADPDLAAAAQALAEKSAQHGRFYAVSPMKREERAALLKAAQGVGGTKVFAEGQGRNRRVVYAPENPAPLPKRSALPVDEDFEE